ncbi:MAG: hypothetical protein WBK28_01840 [Minisyncoccia bacterium]
MPAAFTEFIQNVVREIVSPLITLIGLAALVVFVWGMVEFIRNGDNEEKRSTGQRHMLWGLIGMVIIFGAFTIASIIASTAGAR